MTFLGEFKGKNKKYFFESGNKKATNTEAIKK